MMTNLGRHAGCVGMLVGLVMGSKALGAPAVSPSPHWTAVGPMGARLGRVIGEVGDLNGDGVGEIALGLAPAGTGGAGEVWIYWGGPTIEETPSLTLFAPGSGPGASTFGRALDAGDLDGDGWPDLVVGAPGDGLTTLGRVYGYRGGPRGPASTPTWTWRTGEPGDGFGHALTILEPSGASSTRGVRGGRSVAGRATVFAGAPAAESVGSPAGAVYVLDLGPGEPDSARVVRIASGSFPWASFGASLAGLADDDGGAWLAVGAPDADVAGVGARVGQVHFYRAPLKGCHHGMRRPLDPVWSLEGEAAYQYFGYTVDLARVSVASADVDSSPASVWLAVGAWGASEAWTHEGVVRIFRVTGSAPVPLEHLSGGSVSAWFGASLTWCDLAVDGRPELLVGAPGVSGEFGAPGAGSVSLFEFSARGGGQRIWSVVGEESSMSLGWSVVSGGDLSGDGGPDLVLGAPYYDWDGLAGGRVDLYETEVPAFVEESEAPGTAAKGPVLRAFPNPFVSEVRFVLEDPTVEESAGESVGLGLRSRPLPVFDVRGRRVGTAVPEPPTLGGGVPSWRWAPQATGPALSPGFYWVRGVGASAYMRARVLWLGRG